MQDRSQERKAKSKVVGGIFAKKAPRCGPINVPKDNAENCPLVVPSESTPDNTPNRMLHSPRSCCENVHSQRSVMFAWFYFCSAPIVLERRCATASSISAGDGSFLQRLQIMPSLSIR